MPEMIATKAHWYGGLDREVGERFHVEPEHVHLMMALGRVKVPPASDGTYRTAHIEASPKKKRARASMVGSARKGS